jgi:hypothetical protein
MGLSDEDFGRLEARLEAASARVDSARLNLDGSEESQKEYQEAKRKLAKIRKVWRTHRGRIKEGSPNGEVVARLTAIRASTTQR